MLPDINDSRLLMASVHAQREVIEHIKTGGKIDPLELSASPDGALGDAMRDIHEAMTRAKIERPELANHENFIMGVIGVSITMGVRIGIQYERLTNGVEKLPT